MTANFNPKGFSAILMGDESLTIACGDMILAGGHRIAAVVTQDAAVTQWAAEQELTVIEHPADLVAAKSEADWLLSVANLRMIPQDVLDLPAKGAINFHDGPLPRYAGLNTPAWAIINGEQKHGVSWHVIEGGVDEGDLLVQAMVDIAPDETAFSLNSKCYAAGMESFAKVLAQLEADQLDRTPQDLSQRSYFAKDQRPAGLGILDFRQDAIALSALVRGLDFGEYWNPLCTAKILIGQVPYQLGSIVIADSGGDAAGRVIAVEADALTVATASQNVVLQGITDQFGRPVDLTALVAAGDRLDHPAHPDISAKNEARWRKALTGHDLLAVPLAKGLGQADAQAAVLRLSDDPVSDRQYHAALLSLLHGAGALSGVVAVEHASSNPLAAPWVPLVLEAEATADFASVSARLSKSFSAIEASDGMAQDLLVRDPAINAEIKPDIWLCSTPSGCGNAALSLMKTAEGLFLHYDESRLTRTAAEMVANRARGAMKRASDAKTCGAVWEIPKDELTLLQDTWNATDRRYDRTTIHHAFEAQAARTPDAEALTFEDETLTYATLNARANALAHVLLAKGVQPGMPVGLYTSRGVELLIAALGILKAGGAYVPLDPAYPADRIAHYIKDSGAPIIVTQDLIAGDLPAHTAEVVLINGETVADDLSVENPTTAVGPDDLAYLIYTSGSTGTPKGVMVSHGNVANFFAGMDDRIDHATGAVWLAVTSLSFDISVLELFWTLGRGFKLVLAGDESRTMVSNGPIAQSDRKIAFNLMYWGNDDGIGPKKYELLLEGAKFADAHGFNAVWTPERHFHAFGGPYPNPSVTGAAVAAVTQNLSVRAGSCVAPLHHPARIAEEWAVIDNLTNGRVGLAIASGWQPDDFVLRPENTPPENKPAMYRAIDQLRQLWQGTPVEFPTQDGTPFAVVTQPRPVSKKLPIWVTTAGNPQTWKEAGEIGANVLTHLLGQSVDEVAEKIKIYHAALRDAGHDPADFTVTVMLHTYLADTRAAAEEVARGPMVDYLRSAAGLIKQYAWAFPAFKRPEGATNPFEVNLDDLSEEEMEGILEFAFQRYFNDSGMFGTVADGLARAEQLKRIGVDEIACLIDYGIDTGLVMEGLKPLARVLEQANQDTVLAEDDFSLAAQIIRHDVTHLQCTPSMAQMLVTNDEARMALGRVQHLMVGGEALPGALASKLKECGVGSLQNMYGPTETTIWSTTHVMRGDAPVTAPIGTPIANTQIFILNDKMQMQPAGVEGELWIGGDGVTLGYWQREALTAERFVDNPFGPGKLYQTGDLASWDADGLLQYAGRADAQVKIRGHRIELGEIEARLAEHANVTQAVVIAREMAGGAQLVGYVTTKGPFDEDLARQALAKDLPEIMVPGAIVTLPRMPLTPNKKIDRKALPAPAGRKAQRDSAPVEPVSGTEGEIARIWTAILGVADVRGEDNFFDLGGHSLLAVQAHRDIKVALDVPTLSITDIFRFPRLEALATHIDKAKGVTSVAAPKADAAPVKTETMSKRRAMRAGRSRERA